MSNRQAWFCPSCQKHHAPHVDTCPGVADAVPSPSQPCMPVIVPSPFTAPTRPWWWDQPVCNPPYTTGSIEIGDDPYIFVVN